MKIHTIMTFSKLEEHETGFPDFGSTNLCGWYFTFKDAYRAVTENMCDIWEHCYDYALIEEVEEGLYPSSTTRWFFKFNKEMMMYEPIEEPESLKHFSGFTI